jgi:peptidyl-prolyl cis-trans isomerase C
MHRQPGGRSRTTMTLAFAACALALGVSERGATQPSAAKPVSAPLSPIEQARRSEVVAQIGQVSLTVGQLEDDILSQNPFMQQRYVSADAIAAVLERSVRFELLAQEAERRGYAKQDAVALAVKQNTVQALIKHEFDDKITTASIPADEVSRYYEQHRDEFSRPPTRRASLLVVATQAEAAALLPEAKKGDVRAFRELVRTKSVDETNRQRGGDLRYFEATGRVLDAPAETVDPAVAKAVFDLKQVGDTSGVVNVGDKFAIAKFTGERPVQADTPKQADERIRMRLWREHRQSAIDTELGELRKRLAPEVHPELVDLVRLDTGSAPPSKGLPAGFPHTRPGPIMSPPAE